MSDDSDGHTKKDKKKDKKLNPKKNTIGMTQKMIDDAKRKDFFDDL